MLAGVTDKPPKGLGLPEQEIIYHLIKSKTIGVAKGWEALVSRGDLGTQVPSIL